MKINDYVINTIFVDREGGEINLYGACYDRNAPTLVTVVLSTKNRSDLAQNVFGEKYTNERCIEKLRDRPTHNFIGYLSGPLSMYVNMADVCFVN